MYVVRNPTFSLSSEKWPRLEVHFLRHRSWDQPHVGLGRSPEMRRLLGGTSVLREKFARPRAPIAVGSTCCGVGLLGESPELPPAAPPSRFLCAGLQMKRLLGETSVLRETFARPGAPGLLGSTWCGVGVAEESRPPTPFTAPSFPSFAASFLPSASERKGGSDIARGFRFRPQKSGKENRRLPKSPPK